MGITTYTQDIATLVAPDRVFKALVLDAENVVPKLMPKAVKNIEIVEGDGGAQSIKKMNFVEGYPIKYLKHKIHIVDDKNMVIKYSLIEGEVLGENLEYISYVVSFEGSENGGCICKTISNYHTKDDFVVKEEEIKEGEEKAVELFKAVEAYLLANPSSYA
ncbi:pathogenesis-related protein STH-2-like [Nicotiana tomentosiformis]|uniref:pathogenesis-related protein STH-2-like n=1 Tax=Nicotiana tomentosiformis TaxID=4098 RepID=UPI00051BD967|nr:pathogenesis-related protein STH-2-like [Nicotiana tomentosiformis]